MTEPNYSRDFKLYFPKPVTKHLPQGTNKHCLCNKLVNECKYITITHGKTGASIYDTKNKKLTHVPAFARNVVDKVGAGDALFPILASCLNSKIPTDVSLYIASISAAINSENYASKQIVEKTYFKKYIEHSIK